MFFCKQTYCDTCGVAFKPVTGVGINLCSVHRAPVIEEHRRRSAVQYWTLKNWKQVEEMMIKQQEAEAAEMRKHFPHAGLNSAMASQSHYQGMAGQQFPNPYG